MTTSSSLPQDPTDSKMGTGFMFTTFTFLRFFHLGRWDAMTSTASACEEVDHTIRLLLHYRNSPSMRKLLNAHHVDDSSSKQHWWCRDSVNTHPPTQHPIQCAKNNKQVNEVDGNYCIITIYNSNSQWNDAMQCNMIWRCLCIRYEFYWSKEANKAYNMWYIARVISGWPYSLHFATLPIPQEYSTRSMYIRDRVGHICVDKTMFCKMMEEHVTHGHGNYIYIPTYIL